MIQKMLLAHVPLNPDLTVYCAYLGVGVPMRIQVTIVTDGYTDVCSFLIKSVERHEYPRPSLVRGILHMDINRPGRDPGDDRWPTEVVVECHTHPRTLVYSASGYGLEARITKCQRTLTLEVDGCEFSPIQIGRPNRDAVEADLPAVIAAMATHFGIKPDEVQIVEHD